MPRQPIVDDDSPEIYLRPSCSGLHVTYRSEITGIAVRHLRIPGYLITSHVVGSKISPRVEGKSGGSFRAGSRGSSIAQDRAIRGCTRRGRTGRIVYVRVKAACLSARFK